MSAGHFAKVARARWPVIRPVPFTNTNSTVVAWTGACIVAFRRKGSIGETRPGRSIPSTAKRRFRAEGRGGGNSEVERHGGELGGGFLFSRNDSREPGQRVVRLPRKPPKQKRRPARRQDGVQLSHSKTISSEPWQSSAGSGWRSYRGRPVNSGGDPRGSPCSRSSACCLARGWKRHD